MILLRVKAKSLLCYWAVRDLGISMVQIARRLNLSLAGVLESLIGRGESVGKARRDNSTTKGLQSHRSLSLKL
jgi:hypothetical protein